MLRSEKKVESSINEGRKAAFSPVAIVLGGLSAHIPLIQKLQYRGYFVVLVDYLDNPPARIVADEHVQISIFDKEGIKNAAIERKAKLIINCCLEHINCIISEISEDLCLPTLYSSKIAQQVSDKVLMKTIMVEQGIPTSRFSCISSPAELSEVKLKYPLFVKPADGAGSSGVSRVMREQDLLCSFKKSLAVSRSAKVIIEEESPGRECNAYCYVLEGEAKVLLVSEKYSMVKGGHENVKCIATYAPARISSSAYEAIASIVQVITEIFSLYTTPLFVQLMVDGSDISVIEFACRMPGGYGNRSIEQKLSFDYYDYTISSFLHEKPFFRVADTGEISIVHSMYALPCILGNVKNIDLLIEEGVVADASIARNYGSTISDASGNKEKIGHFVISARSSEEALVKIKRAFEEIKVEDIDGNDVLRRDICLTREVMRSADEKKRCH